MSSRQPAPLPTPDRPVAPIVAAPFTVFDTETTGVNYDESRIVTYAVGTLHTDGTSDIEHGVIDCGIDIPEAAARVHGWTTERVRECSEAQDPTLATRRMLTALCGPGHPVVAFNARFDLTLLARECERAGIDPTPLAHLVVIDPLVIDKQLERYRRGSRRLRDVCTHHGVTLDDWHDAQADAIAAGLLTRVLLSRLDRRDEYRQALDPRALHAAQVTWAREQAESLQVYFNRKRVRERVETVWPVAPRRIGDDDA